jgi:hypothetical protein
MLGLFACTGVNTVHPWMGSTALEMPPAGGIRVTVSKTSVSALHIGIVIQCIFAQIVGSIIMRKFL